MTAEQRPPLEQAVRRLILISAALYVVVLVIVGLLVAGYLHQRQSDLARIREDRQSIDANCQALSLLHKGIETAYERDKNTPTALAQKSARKFKEQLDAWRDRCD